MIRIDIPGFGMVALEFLVSDFTGSLSEDGVLLPGVKETLNRLSDYLTIYILTSDTFGQSKSQMEGVKCEVHILEGGAVDVQKDLFVKKLGAERVVAFGNGKNDRLMLKTAKIGVAICLSEGCAIDSLSAADIFVKSPIDAIGLLLNPERLKATLRH